MVSLPVLSQALCQASLEIAGLMHETTRLPLLAMFSVATERARTLPPSELVLSERRPSRYPFSSLRMSRLSGTKAGARL